MDGISCDTISDQIGDTGIAASVYPWSAPIPASYVRGDLLLEVMLNGKIDQNPPGMEYPTVSQLAKPSMAPVDSAVISSRVTASALYSKLPDSNLESLTQVRSYRDLVQNKRDRNISTSSTATADPSIISTEDRSTTSDSVMFAAAEAVNQSLALGEYPREELAQNGYEIPSFAVKHAFGMTEKLEGNNPQPSYKIEESSSSRLQLKNSGVEIPEGLDMSEGFYVDNGDQLIFSGPMAYKSGDHQTSSSVAESPQNSEDSGRRKDALREMIYRLSAMQPMNVDPSTITRPKRRNVRISNDPQSVAARHRREKISDRIRILQRLVPGGTKMDTASMLDEAIHYVKFLHRQVQALESASAKMYDPWSNSRQASSFHNSNTISNPISVSSSFTLKSNAASSCIVNGNMDSVKDLFRRC